MCGAPESELVPIDEVARRLGIKASAIRYYEERGLVRPRRREAGRRWFGDAEIRRLAIIQYWQSSGLLSLDDIADILAGPRGNRRWPTVVRQHIDSLQAQIDRMTTARAFLEHVLEHHPHEAPDGCHHYETLIWEDRGEDGAQVSGRSAD